MNSSVINGKSIPFLYMYTSGNKYGDGQFYTVNTDVLDYICLTVLKNDMEPATTLKSTTVVLRFEEVNK